MLLFCSFDHGIATATDDGDGMFSGDDDNDVAAATTADDDDDKCMFSFNGDDVADDDAFSC